MTGRFNLQPLRVAGYRSFLLVSLLAGLSLWVYQPSVEWIILRQTGSTAAVGFLQTVMILPIALASIPSGVLADRIGPRRMLATSLLGMASVVAIVGVLGATNQLTFEVAVVMTFMLGVFDGLYPVPAQLILTRLVEPPLLGAAIGLSMLTSGVSRLIGAPLGGSLLQVAGPGPAFLPAALGLLVGAALVISIPLLRPEERTAGALGLRDVGDSVRWMAREPGAIAVTVLGVAAAVFVLAAGALTPTVTRDLLHGGSSTLGLLNGAGGIGAILSAVAMEPLGRRFGRGRLLVASILGSAAGVAALGFSTVLEVSAVLTLLVAFCSMAFLGVSSLLLQTIAPPRMRGRALALYGFAFYGLLPIATSTVGVFADAFGVTAVLVAMGGLAVAITAFVAAWSRSLLATDVGPAGELLVGGAIVPQRGREGRGAS